MDMLEVELVTGSIAICGDFVYWHASTIFEGRGATSEKGAHGCETSEHIGYVGYTEDQRKKDPAPILHDPTFRTPEQKRAGIWTPSSRMCPWSAKSMLALATTVPACIHDKTSCVVGALSS